MLALLLTTLLAGATPQPAPAAEAAPAKIGLCVACHNEGGVGNQALGAPDLTTGTWLYGGSTEALHQTIAEGRHGIMPAHRDLLGETRARLVAAYVWSLSNPPEESAAANAAGAGER